MAIDPAELSLKNPFDWVHTTVTSVLINFEICLSLHRVKQFFNLVDLVLDTKNKNISSTPGNPSHGLSSSVIESLPHNILGRLSKRFDEGRSAMDRQHPTALRKRLSMKL